MLPKSGSQSKPTIHETRLLGKKKKEGVIVLETIEFVENRQSVSETLAAGSFWRTGFQTEPNGSGTLTMEAVPQNFFARIMNLVIGLGMNKGMAEEIDKVKAHCERAEFLPNKIVVPKARHFRILTELKRAR